MNQPANGRRWASPERYLKPLLAVAAGALLGLAFPRFNLGLVAFVALVPLLVALQVPGAPSATVVSGRRAFGLGYAAGAAFFLVLLHWLPRLPQENVTIPFMMVPALLLAVAYLALYPALAVWSAAALARRGAPLGLVLPLTWILAEWLRGAGTFGFPWGSTGYALAAYPHLIQFAEFTGIWGASLWIVLVNGLIHLHLSCTRAGTKLAVLTVLVLVAVGPYLHGTTVLRGRTLLEGVEVGLIQPNIGKEKWQPAVRDSVIDVLLEQTRLLARQELESRPPELIVWPETAIPARLPREPEYMSRVRDIVDGSGVPLLAGFPDGRRGDDGVWTFTNSAGLVMPGQGMVERYDKRHLVPFSEHFPLPFLNRYDFGQSNFSPGKREVVFRQAGPPFGVMICFETIFPGIARGYARAGARYLINITNDQWFGDSAAPVQHFQMNVFRCIENRRGLARAANTGISAVIDPFGVITEASPVFVPFSETVVVPLGEARTVYTTYGDWVLVLAAALVGLFTLAVVFRARGGGGRGS